MFSNADDPDRLLEILRKRVLPIKRDPNLYILNYPNPPQYPKILHEDDYENQQDLEEQKASKILYSNYTSHKVKRKRDFDEDFGSTVTKRGRLEDTGLDSTEEYIPGSCPNLPIPCDLRGDNKEFPEGLYPIHCVCAFIGPRGAGKTTALINLVANYLKHEAFDRLFIISPTYESNPEYDYLFQKMKIKEEHREEYICKSVNRAPAFLENILMEFKADGLEYEAYQKYKQLYDRWRDGEILIQRELDKLSAMNFAKPDDLPRPSACLIVDDMTHTALLSRHSPYPHLLIKHRHVGGTNIGMSIFTLVHNFKTGIPKCARQNVQVFHIWPTADESQLKSIWEETCGGTVPYTTFYQMYRTAIFDEEANKKHEQGHNFFVVDPYNKNVQKRFRQNFDKYLKVQDINDRSFNPQEVPPNMQDNNQAQAISTAI